MFFDMFLWEDIPVMACMAIYLICAAIYDAHGAEVPDAFTVPYAIMGIAASVFHARYIVAIVAIVALVFILVPWRPKFLIRLNEKLLSRHYASDKEMTEEETSQHQQALEFDSKYGNLFRVICIVTSYMGIGLAMYLFALDFRSNIGDVLEQIAVTIIFSVCLWVYASMLRGILRNDDNDTEQPEPLPAAAFGGADAIVFIGMLGFYGVIPFLYGLAASLVIFVIAMLLIRVIKKQSIKGGLPLLPGICATAPIRMLIAVTVCPGVIDTFNWLMQFI